MDNFRYVLAVAALVLAIFAIYMIGTLAPIAEPAPAISLETKDFYRYIDEDLGVVCYVLNTGTAMSCLWLDEESER